MSEPRSREKQKPSRLRRWLLRPVVWLSLLAVLLVIAAGVVVQQPWFGGRMASALGVAATEAVGRQVKIGSLSFQLLPTAVELHDLRIAGGSEGDPYFAEVPFAVAELDVRGLFPPRVVLRHLRLEQPILRLRYWADGGSNLPGRSESASKRGGLTKQRMLTLGAIEVVDGVLEIDQERLPLELEATALRLRLFGGKGADLHGGLEAEEVRIRLPRARPYLGSVALKGWLRRKRIEVSQGLVNGPDLTASVWGSVLWGEDREVVLQTEIRSRGRLGLLLGYFDDEFEGEFQFTGGFAWRREAWGFRGAVRADTLRLFDREVRALEGVLSGDRNGLRLEVARAQYGLGALAGTVSMRPDKNQRPVKVELDLRSVELASLLADTGIPVEGLAGSVSGKLDYAFVTSRPLAGDGWADLVVSERIGVEGGLPVAGKMPLTVSAGEVRSQALELHSDSQGLLARGAYNLEKRAGRFQYELVSKNIEEIIGLLPLEVAEGEILTWAPTLGRGRIEGELTLDRGSAETRMTLAMEEVRAPGYRADRAGGSLHIDGSGVRSMRFDLMQPGAAMLVTGSVPFVVPGPDSETLPFEVTVDAIGWPSEDAWTWLPFRLPAEGKLSGVIRLWGDSESVQGDVRVKAESASVVGLAVDSIAVEARFDPQEIVFERIGVKAPAGELEVSGHVESTTGRWELALADAKLSLDREPLRQFLPGDLSGFASLSGSLGGSMSNPSLVGAAVFHDLAVEGELIGEAGQANLIVDWSDGGLDVAGSLAGVLEISGGGEVKETGVDAEIELKSASLGSLTALALGRSVPGLEGSLEGAVVIRSGTGDGSAPGVSLKLDRLEAGYGQRELVNLEPVRLRLEPDAVVLESLFLGDPEGQGDLFLGGRIGLSEEGSLDLRTQASIDSGWLTLLAPDLGTTRGHFDLLASIGGSLSAPRIDGQGELRDGYWASPILPHALENLSALLLFYPDRILLDSAHADCAGGGLRMEGVIRPFDPPGRSRYRLQLAGEGLEVRYPEGWLLRGGGELVLQSEEEGRLIQGQIDLDRALYLRDTSVSGIQLLQQMAERQREEVGSADEDLLTTRLEVVVAGDGALRIRNNLADLRGDLDLTLHGNLARPGVLGEVRVSAGSTLELQELDYVIERAELTFISPTEVRPMLDLVATTDLRDYDVTLSLSGAPDRLSTTFFSNPPLPDLDVLSLLATGQPSSARGEFQPSEKTSVAVEGLLYGQAASLVAERVNTLFGLDKLRIDPLTGSTGDLSSARVTLGEQISRDLMVIYSYDPSDTEGQVLQVEWAVDEGMVVVLTQDGDGEYSVDARWEREF